LNAIENILEVCSGVVINEGGVGAAISSPIPTTLKIQEFDYPFVRKRQLKSRQNILLLAGCDWGIKFIVTNIAQLAGITLPMGEPFR